MSQKLTFALLETLETARKELPRFLQHAPFEVVLAKQRPYFGALRELLAGPLVLLLRFL